MLRVILRNILSQWGLYALNAVMFLAITPLLVHGLGPDAFGVWVIAGNAVSWLMIMDLGISSAVLRFGALVLKQGQGGDAELNRLFNASLGLYAVIAALAFAAAVLLGAHAPDRFFISAMGRAQFLDFAMLLGATIAASFLAQTFSAILQAHQRFDLVNMARAGGLVIRIVLYAGVILHGDGLLGLAFASLLGAGLYVLALVAMSRHVFAWRIAASHLGRSWAGRLFGYGWPMLMIIVSDQIRFTLDNVILAAYLTLSMVTVFGIGAAITTVFREVVGALVPIFVPYFSRTDGDGAAGPGFMHALRLFSLSVWGLGMLIVACAGPFIAVWVGPYHQSVIVVDILMFGFLLASSQSLSFSLLYGHARHGPVAAISMADAIANLVLSLWLVRTLGVTGVAWGTTIPSLVSYGIVFPIIVSRSMKLSLRAYVRDALLLPAALALAVLLLVNLAWSFWQPHGWGELIAAASIIMVAYAALAWTTVVGAEGRRLVKTMIAGLRRS